MMTVNFIITAHDKEDYLPHLLYCILQYKKIKPSVAIAYNGEGESFPCSVRRPNMGHQHGDHDLTMSGFNHLKSTSDGFRFIKIGIDTFLLNEELIVHIFEVMEAGKCCYAGNRWHGQNSQSLSTDIFFLDTRFGNPLNPPNGMDKDGDDYETWMWRSIHRSGLKWLEIQQRVPVHPDNRMECEKLRWTMHHQLENNLANMKKWGY